MAVSCWPRPYNDYLLMNACNYRYAVVSYMHSGVMSVYLLVLVDEECLVENLSNEYE